MSETHQYEQQQRQDGGNVEEQQQPQPQPQLQPQPQPQPQPQLRQHHVHEVNSIVHGGATLLALSPMTTATAPPPSRRLVYEVTAGRPAWSRLSRLATEAVAQLTVRCIERAVRYGGRGAGSEAALACLRDVLQRELPTSMLREVLDVCVARDRFRCHHNPTDCLALELWRVFYNDRLTDVSVVHHEFAFPKTSNYPEIVQNLDRLLCLMTSPSSYGSCTCTEEAAKPGRATATSFKLELKQCEVGFFLEERLISCLGRFSDLRQLDLPGLCSDKLLNVIALHCTNLEALGLAGSREQVTDVGFATFVEIGLGIRANLRRLDVSRCSLTQQSLLPLRRLSALSELRLSTTLLDDISCACDGGAVLLQADTGEPWGLDSLALPNVRLVTVENDSYVQVSINKVMSYLRNVYPRACDIELANCIACELHVTLTQHPTNITYMRETIQTLERK